LIKNDKKVVQLWEEKKNLILYGPPGTSKTYRTKDLCNQLLVDYDDIQSKTMEFITFHPSYQYEQFMEGLTIDTPVDGKPVSNVSYILKPGIFKILCKRALGSVLGYSDETSDGVTWSEIFKMYCQDEKHFRKNLKMANPYILIIDEINRGDISRIFGELITLIEPSKRLGEPDQNILTLPLSRDKFCVPPNLYILGTMNTSDRSIALLDIALRRRFGFIEMLPDYSLLEENRNKNEYQIEKDVYVALSQSWEALKKINARICENKFLGRDKQIGHTYLMNIFNLDMLYNAWRYSIIPLLEEYCYNDYSKINELLVKDSENKVFCCDQTGINNFEVIDLIDVIVKS
jgi:5-methylcytosine-specific restriction protein B